MSFLSRLALSPFPEWLHSHPTLISPPLAGYTLSLLHSVDTFSVYSKSPKQSPRNPPRTPLYTPLLYTGHTGPPTLYHRLFAAPSLPYPPEALSVATPPGPRGTCHLSQEARPPACSLVWSSVVPSPLAEWLKPVGRSCPFSAASPPPHVAQVLVHVRGGHLASG